MRDDQRNDGMIESLRKHYNEPPPYPKDEIEAGVLGRSGKVARRSVSQRFTILTALAASLALFFGGVAVGRATDRATSEPPSRSTSVSNTPVSGAASAEGYTVSWF